MISITSLNIPRNRFCILRSLFLLQIWSCRIDLNFAVTISAQ